MKGSIGTSTGTIIHTRNKKPKPCNCKLCKHGRIMNGKVYCMMSGSTGKVNPKTCKYYFGPYIQWKDEKVPKRKSRRKISSKGCDNNGR